MKCTNCQTINEAGSKFCTNCGAQLPIVCGNCGTVNDPNARFCKNCGNPLQVRNGSGLPVVENYRNPSFEHVYDPVPASTAKLGTQPGHMAGERRIMTVLFADVVDSTALAEKMDAEDWTVIMNRAFGLLAPVIQRYDGTIARLMGDALLAFFGAPAAHEDDPLRAAHAALEMIQVLKNFSEEIRPRFGIDFSIRVGINTGPVVLGEVGSSHVYEYTAMGDAVNLAARMQAMARPMTALITENTFRFIDRAFECKDLGNLAIKGKAEPVHVFELQKAKLQNEPQRGLYGLKSPMVGRDEELGILLRLAQIVQAGLGRAVIVMGEPGIGKSRLIGEWKSRLAGLPGADGAGMMWVEGRCLSFGQGMPYQLLVDVIHSILSIPPGADCSETDAALQTLCETLFGEQMLAVYPYLGHLLSLPLEGEAFKRVQILDPQALQGQYLASIRQLLVTLASRKPLVIVLDDIHWADPSSVDLLIRLIPLVMQSRILFCLAARPDREAYGLKLVTATRELVGASLTEIVLQALSEYESNLLVSNLLNAIILPEALHQLILSKTEGNPLFVEEVIRMFIERGVLMRQEQGWKVAREVDRVEIPDNLQSLLLARVDRLPEEARRTLKVAAVIGKQFSAPVVEEMLKQNPAADISNLETVGLISLASSVPEIEYTFRHTLIQEVVYGSILKSERVDLHRLAGEALEQLYSNRREEMASRLAEHFWQAGEQQRALEYFLIAAENASRSYANREAIEYYTRTLNASNENFPLQAKILRARGTLYEMIGDFQRAKSDQEAGLRLAQVIQDPMGVWQGMINLGMLWAARDYRETEKYYRQALDQARSIGDERVIAHSLNRLGNYYINEDRPLESKKHHEEAMQIFLQLEDEAGMAETMDLIGMSDTLGGDLVKGLWDLRQSSKMFEKLGNRTGLSSSLATLSILTMDYQSDTMVIPRFSVDEALHEAERAYQVAAEIGWRSGEVYSIGTMALCLVSLGHYDRAFDCIQKGKEILGEIQHHQWATYLAIVNGALHLDLNALDQAQVYFEQALVMAQQNRSIHWTRVSCGLLASTLIQLNQLDQADLLLNEHIPPGTPARSLGQRLGWSAYTELALAKGDLNRAAESINRLMTEAVFHSKDDIILGLWILRGKVAAAHAQREKTDPQKKEGYLMEAEKLFQAALAEAQAMNYRAKIWRIHLALYRVYESMGQNEAAEHERQTAREIVLELADHVSDKKLKTIFLHGAFAN
jgi:class 3 adenylate cyclase/tetratricopeptide (TPR) repeat protein